jgi:hypothetical protein
MAERFSDIEKPLVSNQPGLEERLKEYPELKSKIEAMLVIIENSGGDVEKAAEAERRIIEELRQMGSEVLHGWARRQQQKKEQEYASKRGGKSEGKKALLVHPAGDHRNRRTDLHPRSGELADPTLLRIRGSGVPWVFRSPAANHDGFRGRWCLCRSRSQAEATLWD